MEDMASTYTLLHAKERLSSATNKASPPMSLYYPVPLHRLSYAVSQKQSLTADLSIRRCLIAHVCLYCYLNEQFETS